MIEKEYHDVDISGEDYIKKIIQIPIYVPKWDVDNISELIENNIVPYIGKDYSNIIENGRDIIALAVKANPRALKRFVNSFILSFEIFKRKNKEKANDEKVGYKYLIAELVKFEWKKFYDGISEANDNDLKKLNKIIRELLRKDEDSRKEKIDDWLKTGKREAGTDRPSSRNISVINEMDNVLWELISKTSSSFFNIDWNIHKQSSVVLESQSETYIESDEEETVLEDIERMLKKDPKNVNAVIDKGIALGNRGKDEEAIQAFDKVLEIEPNNVNALFNKGYSLTNLEKNEEAIHFFDKVLEINPHHFDAQFNKGYSLGELGKHNETVEAYDKALEIEPNDVNALYNKGHTLNKLGKHKEVIEVIDKALKIDPKHAFALVVKGISQSALGSKKEAIKTYDKVLKIDLNNFYAQVNKANALYDLKKYEEAIRSYDQALEINPNDQEALKFKKKSEELLGKK